MATKLCIESSYSYKAVLGTQCLTSSCTTGIPFGGVVGYVDITSGSYTALMTAVNQQPVSVAIEADQAVFQFYVSGVISASSCGTSLNHAVLLVGYGTTSSGLNYWLIKNSWSTSWGMSGYVLLERSGTSGAGTCGVQRAASYPVVKKLRRLSTDLYV
jgi:KDEL-tailed cysteine endopeptidase